MKEGKPVTVDIYNDTDVPELVHWHGQMISAKADGAGDDLRKYYQELRRLRLNNPKLDRTMLERYWRTMYRDELEKLNLKPSDIYGGCFAEERRVSEPPSAAVRRSTSTR